MVKLRVGTITEEMVLSAFFLRKWLLVEEWVLVEGSFKARALEWGMRQSDSRNIQILHMATRIKLTVLNIGSTMTCGKYQVGGTLGKLTLVNLLKLSQEGQIRDWIISELNNWPYHHNFRCIGAQKQNQSRGVSWMLVSDWNCKFRRNYLTLQEFAQRARSQDAVIRRSAEYKKVRQELRHEINRQKVRCWQELISDINRDSWGLGYKLVITKKLGAHRPACSMQAVKMKEIV